MRSRGSSSWTRVVLALALLARLAFFLASRPWDPRVESDLLLKGDALGYHQLAVTLRTAGQFAYVPGGAPEALRTPGYPAFLALVYALCGVHPWAALLAQVLLDVATCALVMALARVTLGERAAPWAGLFYALDPFACLHANLLLSEALFLSLVTLGGVTLARALRNGPESPPRPGVHRGLALAAGLLLGFATLVRPVLVYLPALLAVAIVAWAPGRLTRRVVLASLLAAGFGLANLPWAGRNARAFGTWGLSTSGPYNLLVLDAAPALAAAEGGALGDVSDRLLARADSLAGTLPHPAGRDDAFVRARAARTVAVAVARRYPAVVARHFALGMVHSFTNLGTGAFARARDLGGESTPFEMNAYHGLADLGSAWSAQKSAGQKVVGALVACELAVVDLAALVGLAWAARRKRWRPIALLLGFAAYFVLVAGSGGQARLRLPALPFYLPLAGAGMAWLAARPRRFLPWGSDTRRDRARSAHTIPPQLAPGQESSRPGVAS